MPKTKTKKDAKSELSAKAFVARMEELRSPAEAKKYLRYFKTGKGEYGEGDVFIGVRMGQVFGLAKEFIDMPLKEIEKLLDGKFHEVKAGGYSIMDKQARRKKTSEEQRKALFDLYMRKHDRANNWDFVDLAAPYVVGGYLFDKPRDVLYKLAKSKSMWERRTAIISTLYFLRQGEIKDALKIAEMLLKDERDLIHKASGTILRVADGVNRPMLLAFLDKHAARMPRVMLRYAIEHLDKNQREKYMGMGK